MLVIAPGWLDGAKPRDVASTLRSAERPVTPRTPRTPAAAVPVAPPGRSRTARPRARSTATTRPPVARTADLRASPSAPAASRTMTRVADVPERADAEGAASVLACGAGNDALGAARAEAGTATRAAATAVPQTSLGRRSMLFTSRLQIDT